MTLHKLDRLLDRQSMNGIFLKRIWAQRKNSFPHHTDQEHEAEN